VGDGEIPSFSARVAWDRHRASCQLKHSLAAKHRNNRTVYTDGQAGVVRDVLKRAADEYRHDG
jgi:hypothetical protein